MSSSISSSARAIAWLASALLALSASAVDAAEVPVTRNTWIGVKSLKELRFERTVRQEHDFSCGAAAVATLLTYHYGSPTPESQVFDFMLKSGDRQKIERVGFSLLDMKRFLVARGYAADGYRVELAKLQSARIPAIALITVQGYRHFVVLQGISDSEVLVSDPAAGARALPRAEFEAIRDPVLLIVRSSEALSLRLVSAWTLRPAPFLGLGRDRNGWGRTALGLPRPNQL